MTRGTDASASIGKIQTGRRLGPADPDSTAPTPPPPPAGPAGRPPLTSAEVIQLAESSIKQIDEQIKLADAKAGFLVGLTGVSLGALSLSEAGAAARLWSAGAAGVLATMGLVLIVLLLVSAALFAVAAVTPDLSRSRRRVRNLFYFGDVAAEDEETFAHRFTTQTADEARDACLAQLHVKSCITHRKLRKVGIAFRLATAALVAWAATYLLMLFAVRLT